MPENLKYPIRCKCIQLMGDLKQDVGRRTSKDIMDLVNSVAESHDILFSQITMPFVEDLKEP